MSGIQEQVQTDVPSVTHDTLPDNAVLLDIRESHEWAAGRAPHSLNIPLSQIEARLDEIPGEGTIVVVCRDGARSARVVEFLLSRGHEAANLAGGMIDWQRGNRPMRHDGPGCPVVIDE